jgi:hypothetical protein
LIRLHNSNIQDFIRLNSGGLEGQYHQIQALQKFNFYYNEDVPNLYHYWLNTFNSIFYVLSSAIPDQFDEDIDNWNLKEKKIPDRDFTGPDFTAWTKALFNPTEPYEARGIHPTGVGINRYIKPSQLNDNEKKFLIKQGRLQFINLISPHLFGFSKIKLKNEEDYYFNFAFRHVLTSFGYDVFLDIFYQTTKDNLFFAIHNYHNYKASFWGLEASLIDKKIPIENVLITAKGIVWTQPKGQSFTDKKSELG